MSSNWFPSKNYRFLPYILRRRHQLGMLTPAPGFFLDSASCELPLLTPCSKAVMSQALKATFSGFKKEQRRLGIPKSKCLCPAAVGSAPCGTDGLGRRGTRRVVFEAHV